MEPNDFIKKLREYPLASHRAWNGGDKVLKMDWNEADIRLPGFIKKPIVEFINNGFTSWYPDAANSRLLNAIAKYCKLPVDHVQYFQGVDNALDYIVRTFVSPGDPVGIVSPTYDNFRVFVESMGAIPTYFFNEEDIFKPDIRHVMDKITPKIKLVYLVNPNNPTGVIYSAKDLEKLISNFPKTLFIIDEAYYEFAGVTVIALVKKYKNLLVTRSLSKGFGLASFRLGYIATDPENIRVINKIRNGKNISALAQVAGISAFNGVEYMKKNIKDVLKARKFVCKELKKMGFRASETPANFILVKTVDPVSLCKALESKNVFIRNLGHLTGMQGYVRITITNEVGAKKFIRIIQGLLKDGTITSQ